MSLLSRCNIIKSLHILRPISDISRSGRDQTYRLATVADGRCPLICVVFIRSVTATEGRKGHLYKVYLPIWFIHVHLYFVLLNYIVPCTISLLLRTFINGTKLLILRYACIISYLLIDMIIIYTSIGYCGCVEFRNLANRFLAISYTTGFRLNVFYGVLECS